MSNRPNQKLSYDEEKTLETALIKFRRKGHRVSRIVIKKLAIKLFDKKPANIFTYYWAAHWAARYGFVRRKATRRQKVWKLSEWTEQGSTFQDKCAEIINEFNLGKNDVGNADETRVTFGRFVYLKTYLKAGNGELTLEKRGSTSVSLHTQGNFKQGITVMCGGFASGRKLTLAFIF